MSQCRAFAAHITSAIRSSPSQPISSSYKHSNTAVPAKPPVMPTAPPQKPNHTAPANPFGPLIATSFHSNGTLRQYYNYTPTADTSNQDNAFRLGATQATKRRNGLSEGIVQERHNATEEGVTSVSGRSRSWDSLAECPASEDVEDTGIGGDGEGSDVSSHTVGRSESSSSTLAADEDDGKEVSSSDDDGDEDMVDTESDKDDENSEASSHTVGRSEDSDSGDDGGDEDSDEEMGESDDEGDVFEKSYREGSRK